MDTKKSLIILGSVAAAGAALYFILKPNSAKAASSSLPKYPKFPTGLLSPLQGDGGIGAPFKTKDCVVNTFNCYSTTKETIKIPLDANCMDYQPAMPQCAPPREYGPSKGAPDYSFDDDGYTYYGGYYAGYYTPSGGLPYSDKRVVKNSGYYSSPEYIGLGAGGPFRGRGSYGYDVQMVERDSRRPAYV